LTQDWFTQFVINSTIGFGSGGLHCTKHCSRLLLVMHPSTQLHLLGSLASKQPAVSSKQQALCAHVRQSTGKGAASQIIRSGPVVLDSPLSLELLDSPLSLELLDSPLSLELLDSPLSLDPLSLDPLSLDPLSLDPLLPLSPLLSSVALLSSGWSVASAKSSEPSNAGLSIRQASSSDANRASEVRRMVRVCIQVGPVDRVCRIGAGERRRTRPGSSVAAASFG
jgi:hypothetical protein